MTYKNPTESYDSLIVCSPESDSEKHCELELALETYTIRNGSFSTGALDPDEYYGISKTEIDIVSCILYDNYSDEKGKDLLAADTIPEWVISAIENEYEVEL